VVTIDHHCYVGAYVWRQFSAALFHRCRCPAAVERGRKAGDCRRGRVSWRECFRCCAEARDEAKPVISLATQGERRRRDARARSSVPSCRCSSWPSCRNALRKRRLRPSLQRHRRSHLPRRTKRGRSSPPAVHCRSIREQLMQVHRGDRCSRKVRTNGRQMLGHDALALWFRSLSRLKRDCELNDVLTIFAL